MKRPDGTQTSSFQETAELILNKFVPADHPDIGELIYHGPIASNNNTLDPQTVKAAIWRMRTSSAPGMDGITAGMVRKAWSALGLSITHQFDA